MTLSYRTVNTNIERNPKFNNTKLLSGMTAVDAAKICIMNGTEVRRRTSEKTYIKTFFKLSIL